MLRGMDQLANFVKVPVTNNLGDNLRSLNLARKGVYHAKNANVPFATNLSVLKYPATGSIVEIVTTRVRSIDHRTVLTAALSSILP